MSNPANWSCQIGEVGERMKSLETIKKEIIAFIGDDTPEFCWSVKEAD
jgi:hypothetical protein